LDVGEWITVGSADEVPEGEATPFAVGDAEIAVARSNGTLYAFSDICTHRGCNLANGGEVEWANEADAAGNVIDRLARLELIEKPQSLLRKRKRQIGAGIAATDGSNPWSGFLLFNSRR